MAEIKIDYDHLSSKRASGPYSEETIKKKRKMPKRNIVIMVVLVILQIAAIIFASCYDPEPQPLDLIEEYNVTVTPNYDGTLKIEYDILWRALDDSEPLTWVEIGVPNNSYTIDQKSFSDTISYVNKYSFTDYTSVRVNFKDSYIDGETVRFSFSITQSQMLCREGDDFFIEFVPGWFNEISVEKYRFAWYDENVESFTEGAEHIGDYYVYEGSLDRGGYKLMRLGFNKFAFDPDADTVEYVPFDDGGAFDGLDNGEDKAAVWILVVFIVIAIFIAELYLVDSFVSYHRGRGFMMGYGHPIHVYGYGNPRYHKAAQLDAEKRAGGVRGCGGRSGGGGCACACACACAGGGRAGCSAKARLPESKNPEE